jgi:hypothetical protein
MAGVWVTAGAPLASGDGWRVWYSWPDGDFEPQLPRVRTPAGVELGVEAGDWAPETHGRRMGVREIRVRSATPGALYEITVPERDGPPLRWRTLPAAIPDDGMSVLIGSCFWINDDREGFYAAAVRELVERERPAFKLLIGDQLYVDVWPPSVRDFPRELAAKYERYWGDPGYQELLAACPTLVSCDDHEFWNDFPEPQPHVPYSWPSHAAGSTAALLEHYDAYQAALNPGGARWYSLTVDPVSFFVADTRSHRTRSSDPGASLAVEQQWQDLERWARELKGPGLLVLPQPLLKLGGSKTDRTLLDFTGDVNRLATVFEGALGGATGDGRPHDILILTGDIHTGRLSSAGIVGLPGDVYELVASPASLVTPYLPPWGHKPSELPDRLTINGKLWVTTGHQRLTPTVDNNLGLVRIAPGRNGRYRVTLQLWRIRPFVGTFKRLFGVGPKPAKGAQPIHQPIELELR